MLMVVMVMMMMMMMIMPFSTLPFPDSDPCDPCLCHRLFLLVGILVRLQREEDSIGSADGSPSRAG